MNKIAIFVDKLISFSNSFCLIASTCIKVENENRKFIWNIAVWFGEFMSLPSRFRRL